MAKTWQIKDITGLVLGTVETSDGGTAHDAWVAAGSPAEPRQYVEIAAPTAEVWAECEFCGWGVSPQASVYGMPVHGECWRALGAKGRERTARRHGINYDAAEEVTA